MKKIFFLIAVIIGSFLLIYAKSKSSFPEKLDFSGEVVPVSIPDVQERMDKELVINQYLHGSTILILKRANKFFPLIEPILAKNNIPDDFKYLCVIESSLTNATSSAGAKGFWQFMPQTAKELGMEVNESVDERYNLEKATEAACQYFLKAKERFGSWTMAAASYNGGMSGLQKQIEFQEATNYYDLLLVEETSRYVFRILALKEIMKNPPKYGFNLAPEDLYARIPTKKIIVDSTITNLSTFAKSQGINYKELKLQNPWLRENKLTNTSNKTYTIEIPIKGAN